MRLQRLKVEQLRQFRKPFEIDGIEPGLNLFVGPNEAGKSTLVRAIRAAFFERHRSTTVEDLRPWGESTAAPTVELDFLVGDTAFRLRKSFLQRKRCELRYGTQSLDGEDAERHLAALLGFAFAERGASRPELWGIPGLLWIEQGQAQEIKEPVRHAADHLRQALESSVGEVASTQGDTLIARIRSERDLLLTPETRKPTAELKKAIDARDEAQARLADIDLRIEGWRQQVDRFATLKAEHAAEAVAKPWESLLAQQQQAEQALAASEALVRQREADTVSLRQAEDRVRLFEQQLAAFEEERQALALREAGLADAVQRLDAASAIEARRASEQASADTAHAAAAADLDRARQRDLQDELALRRDESDARIQELDALLQRCASEQVRIGQLRQHAAAGAIEAADVERLRGQGQALEALHIRRQVVATRIRFELVDGAPATLDGAALAGSGERLITVATTIDIAGIGRIEVLPGGDTLAALAREEADQRAAHEDLLRRCAVADVAEAEARLAAHRQALQDAALAAATLATLAPKGIEALQADLAAQVARRDAARARLAALAQAGQPKPFSPGSPPLPLAEAEVHHAAAKRHADTLAAQLAEARQARLLAHEQHEAAAREHGRLKSRIDAPDRQERQREAGRQLLASRAEQDALRAAIADRTEAIAGTEPDMLKQSVARFRRSAELVRQAHDERKEQITRLGGSLEEAGAQGFEEARAGLAVSLEAAVRRHRELDLRAKALDLLHGRLEAKRQELTRRLRAPLQARIDHYLRLLFPKAALEIGDDLLPRLLTRPASQGDECGAVSELSHGAREQMGVLTRLAYADLLKDAGRPTLVILDDALVHSDTGRLERMKRVLFDAAQRHQVLLFTCHPAAWRDMGVVARPITRG
jgi:energy-coupling factor transporter ATP-binding protein EcfA2